MPESNFTLLIWKKRHQVHVYEVCSMQVILDKIFLDMVTEQITYIRQQGESSSCVVNHDLVYYEDTACAVSEVEKC